MITMYTISVVASQKNYSRLANHDSLYNLYFHISLNEVF